MRNLDVVDAFIKRSGKPVHTGRSETNGYYRVSTGWGGGYLTLFNYRTEIAYSRLDDDGMVRIYTNPKKYSVTTTKLQNQIAGLLHSRGYRPTGRTLDLAATVPGRWYGAGPAWHPTGWEELPFVEWAHKDDIANEGAVRPPRQTVEYADFIDHQLGAAK